MAQELYELPEGWEWKSLSKIATVIMGQSPSGNTYNRKGEGMPLINGPVEFSPEPFGKTIQIQHTTAPNKKCQKGDLLLCVRGATTGRTNIAAFDACIGRGVAAIRHPNQKFIGWMVRAQAKRILDKGKGSTFPAITGKELKELLIPVPPLAEQKRIVAQLDVLFSRIDQTIAQLQDTQAQTKALWASALEETRLKVSGRFNVGKVDDYLQKIQTGTTPPKNNPSYYQDPSIPWFAPSDLGKVKVLSESRNMVSEVAVTEGKAKIFVIPSLLLVAIGATVGKIGLLKARASSNQQITAIHFDKDILHDYAYYWFSAIKDTIINKASAATLPIINQKGIRELPFAAPPLPEQEKIVAQLDAIAERTQALEATTATQLEQLKALKASLLDAAFRGQL